MRILHVVRQFHPAIGGLEVYVKNMVICQQSLGHECAVLTLNRVFHGNKDRLPSYELIENIPVYRVSFIGKKRFFVPLVAPSFLKRYDIIHVHNTDGFFDYISFLAKGMGKPAFATTHGGFFHTRDFSAFKKIYFDMITRHTGKGYRALFAISKNDFNIFKGINDNLLLKPNAIAPPGNFLASGNDFVYLGRLAKHKNITNVIQVFAALKTSHGIKGRLHIIGPEWDVSKSDLMAVAERAGIGRDVDFYGYLDQEKMEIILKKCGWFLSASTYEGFGMSMLEAMAVGLIPFVQPNESFNELIEMANVGACVDFTEAGPAAARIAALMDSIGADDREKARAFSQIFSWEKLAEDTIAAYREYGG